MAFHREKKVEVIVPEALVGTVLEVARGAGSRGYTLMPTKSGQGQSSSWHEEEPAPGNRPVVVLIIAKEAIARKIAEAVFPVLSEYGGIVYLTDAEVFRPDRF